MSYSDKLRDPRWQKKRLIILERDKWQCRICEDETATLHVHHVFYDSLAYPDPWDYPDYCLVTLCSRCHESEHFDYKNSLLSLQHEMAKSGICTSDCVSYLQSIIKERFKDGVYHG